MNRFPLISMRRIGEASVALTPAKINLFLEIEGRRDDGYHDVTTVLLAVDLRDRIVLRIGADPEADDSVSVDGPHGGVVPDHDDNLVVEAIKLLRAVCPVPPVDVLLTKRIPPGAGLGGGSGNAAGILALADSHFHLQLDDSELREMAAQLGGG